MYRSDCRFPLETSSNISSHRGFVPAPHSLMIGVGTAQLAWQQAVYARAYSAAAAVCCTKVLVWKQDHISRN